MWGLFEKSPHTPKNFQKRNSSARPHNYSYPCMGKNVRCSKE